MRVPCRCLEEVIRCQDGIRRMYINGVSCQVKSSHVRSEKVRSVPGGSKQVMSGQATSRLQTGHVRSSQFRTCYINSVEVWAVQIGQGKSC